MWLIAQDTVEMKPRFFRENWATTLGVGLVFLAAHSYAGVAQPPSVPTVSTNGSPIPGGVTMPIPGVGVQPMPPGGMAGGVGIIPTNAPAAGGGVPGAGGGTPGVPGAGGGIPGIPNTGGVPGAGGGTPSIPGAGGNVPGIPGADGGVPSIPGAGGLTPPTVNTNGIPVPGAGLPGSFGPGAGLPGGVSTNAPPQLTPQEIAFIRAQQQREAVRVLIKESKVIRRAAREGNPRQQHNLAVLYTWGIGVPLDFKLAHYWFKKAALQGLRESQFNLGIAHQGGMGVQKDFVTAYQYYSLAATEGLPNAAYWRDNIAQYMSREQIENGNRLTRGFRQKIEQGQKEKDSESALQRRLNRILGIDPNNP